QAGLAPEKVDDSNSFYGIKINLKEIGKTVKTVRDYELDKAKLANNVADLKKQLLNIVEVQEDEFEKLRRKYHPKIKECKESIQEIEYRLEQDNMREETATISLNDIHEREKAEREKDLAALENEIEKSAEELVSAELALKNLEEAITRQVNVKERER